MDNKSLTLVATYRRTIHASLERIWENVLDWEHLPDLWRARVVLAPAEKQREAIIAIQTDRLNFRYWSRTLTGQGAGGEILTYLTPRDERMTDIVVEFRTPFVAPAQADALGTAYLRFYERLWNEDERMMLRRQMLLDSGWHETTKKTKGPHSL
jgi:hypothetical protein